MWIKPRWCYCANSYLSTNKDAPMLTLRPQCLASSNISQFYKKLITGDLWHTVSARNNATISNLDTIEFVRTPARRECIIQRPLLRTTSPATIAYYYDRKASNGDPHRRWNYLKSRRQWRALDGWGRRCQLTVFNKMFAIVLCRPNL